MENKFAIQAINLTRKFGDFTAVDAISFEVKEGEVFGFLGANGAGKTTAIKMLTGLIKPTSGNAFVAGFDIKNNADQIKENIGYMSQQFSLYKDLTIKQNINFWGGIYGLSNRTIKEKTDSILTNLDLQNHAKKMVRDLPTGWRQRLAFAVAGIHDPKIIFLDEPTSGVDPTTRRQFWEMIYDAAEHGTTIFVTTHYMDEAEYCNRICIMVDGKIQAMDSPRGLKNSFSVSTINEVFLKLARTQK